MTRAPIFSTHFPVPPEAIDMQGHVSNLAYVGWMQDIAIEHSAAVGWPMPRYLAAGAGWVVRSHYIEYLRPAFADELVSAHTWFRDSINGPPRASTCSFAMPIGPRWRRRRPSGSSWISSRAGAARFRPSCSAPSTPCPRRPRCTGRWDCARDARASPAICRSLLRPVTLMADKFTLEYSGREYTVQRGDHPASAAEGGGAPVGRHSWYVTLGPKAITRIDAMPGDGESAVRARVRQWLEEHPEMPDSEDIVFGGG